MVARGRPLGARVITCVSFAVGRWPLACPRPGEEVMSAETMRWSPSSAGGTVRAFLLLTESSLIRSPISCNRN